jgi:DNA-binding transcriptional regulator YdaS (Cro superfamily)
MKLRDYIDVQRGRSACLAREMQISPTLIAQWASTRRVPAERCPEIEKFTGGQVRCEELRPDVDWAYLRATDCQAPAPEHHQEAA